MTRYVLDASVIAAAALVEAGADQAARMMANGIISTVNLSEALQRIAEVTQSMEKALWAIASLQIERVPFDENQAIVAATLRAATKRRGISFADRACLSLA